MKSDSISKHIRNKGRKIVHIHVHQDNLSFVVAHVPQNTDVQFEMFHPDEFKSEQRSEQTASK